MKKALILMLVLAMVFSTTASSFACGYHDSWDITDTDYGDTASDAATATAIAGILTGVAGYGAIATWMGVASTIEGLSGEYWTAYYKKETHTSPDFYAYLWRTTWYENENYTGQIDDPVCSQVYYITARVAM